MATGSPEPVSGASNGSRGSSASKAPFAPGGAFSIRADAGSLTPDAALAVRETRGDPGLFVEACSHGN